MFIRSFCTRGIERRTNVRAHKRVPQIVSPSAFGNQDLTV
jgi:hypothetical protein